MQPLNQPESNQADGTLRLGLAGSGDFRWAIVDLSGPLEALRRRLDPSPVAAVAIGRCLSAAALLLRFSTKDPGRLRFELLGDGPLGKVIAEVSSDGLMRAMADELRFAGVDGNPLDVGAAVGTGLLRVTQENAQHKNPYVSQTELVSGNVGDDVVRYLEQSLQIRSAALLTTKPATSGIVAAGGLLVEALPGADESRLVRLEKNIATLGDLGALVESGGEQGLLAAVMDGFDIEELEEHTLRYGCACSRDVLLQRLMALPPEDLQEVADDAGKATLECAFCLGHMTFSVDELQAAN